MGERARSGAPALPQAVEVPGASGLDASLGKCVRHVLLVGDPQGRPRIRLSVGLRRPQDSLRRVKENGWMLL